MFNRTFRTGEVTILAGVLVLGILLGGWITKANPSGKFAGRGDEIALSKSAPRKLVTPAMASIESAPGSQSQPVSAPDAYKRSLQEILKHPGPDRVRELEEFARDLPATEFGAMLKELRRMPNNNARELASRLLIARWTDVDPEGALQFAAENRDFDYIADDVFQQFAAGDLQSALARAQRITDPNLRYDALRGVLSYMAEQDPTGALKLAGTLGSFPNNEPLAQVIYRQWSDTDPKAAAAQAALDSSGDGWRSPVSQVLRNWASQDPLSALAWSNSLSDPSAQARDVGQIVRQWSRNDVNAAANWVDSVPAGSVRDAAVASLAYSLAGTDPSAAVGWAQSIADASARDEALQRLSRQIMFRDPSNGLAVLQAAGVPANLIPPPPNPNPNPNPRGRGR